MSSTFSTVVRQEPSAGPLLQPSAKELKDSDHILIDLPPALGRLRLNKLIWADRVVAVTEPAAFSAKGLTEFLKTVKKVQSLPHLNRAWNVLALTSSPLTGEHIFQIGELDPNMEQTPVLRICRLEPRCRTQ